MSSEVIIVDDDKIVIFLHTTLLKKLNFAEKPLVFESGQKVLNYLLSADAIAENYLILLDIAMPVMDGWEFLEELNKFEINHKCHVVMITSSVDFADKARIKQFPKIIEYVEKPLTVDKIMALKNNPLITKLLN